MSTVQLSAEEYAKFTAAFQANSDGRYTHLRFGQAFHQHFNLQKVDTNRSIHDVLYQRDGAQAIALIAQHFEFI